MKKAAIIILSIFLYKGIVSEVCSQGRNQDEIQDTSDFVKVFPESRDGLLFFESKDQSFCWWLDSRMYLDGAVYFENTLPLSNGTELRKARMAFKSTLWKHWAAEVDVDFADQEVDVKDMWVGYFFSNNSHLKFGNFKEPFGMETTTSSRYFTFLERAYPSKIFSPSRHIGVAATHFSRRYWVSGGVFGEEVEAEEDLGDEGYAFTGRAVAFPVYGDKNLLHIGVAATHRFPQADGVNSKGVDNPRSVRFRGRPETHVNRARFLNTDDIYNTKSYSLFGFELAASYGPVFLQSEYMITKVQRENDLSTLTFTGGYAQINWLITGEHRPYWRSQAEFGRIKPENKYGAFELAARYSTIDLNDRDAKIMGGEAENITLALNWYPNTNFRFMFNYILVNNDRFANGAGDYTVPQGEAGKGGEDFSFIQLRLLAYF